VTSTLADVATRIRSCTRCELCRTRTQAVPGNGNPDAEIMFIGEAPGWYEDQQGLPFVGAAGQFLNGMLEKIGLKRSDVFVTNVVKCRPPGNRDPLPDEISACSSYLDEQIALIKPTVVVTLGRFSMARWFPGERISRIHGQARRFDELIVVPMYHPAAAIHQGTLRATVEADMLKLPRIIEEAQREVQEAETPKPEQMRLF
jgi:uracil-DNA glycosylase family 4